MRHQTTHPQPPTTDTRCHLCRELPAVATLVEICPPCQRIKLARLCHRCLSAHVDNPNTTTAPYWVPDDGPTQIVVRSLALHTANQLSHHCHPIRRG